MKEEKVVSFKVSNEIYAKLKESGKTFREVLEPLLEHFFNTERSIHPSIPKETPVDYESICQWLDSIKEAKNED